jgi:hypothetical protein
MRDATGLFEFFWAATQSEHIRSSASRHPRQNVRPQLMHPKEAGAPHLAHWPTSTFGPLPARNWAVPTRCWP